MGVIIDNIELDSTNEEFFYASDFVNKTNKLLYLTGKAGTGKTTFLKYLRETTKKNIVVLAYTGVAAVNAGGETINSFFKINPSVYIPNDKRLRTIADPDDVDRSTIYNHFSYNREKLAVIRGLELLVIDEVSMVRCDLLDVVDRLLRVFRGRINEPFGGVQVVLIGDTFQLPPIARFDEWELLKPYYKSTFFFSSKVIEQNKPIYIELKKIYRQKEQEFIDLLNRVRINQVSDDELNLLNSKYNPTFLPNNNSNYITLATHNNLVNDTNLKKLNELTTELKRFEASVIDIFPDNIMPTDRILQLKEGSQIMFIKNDRVKGYYSGQIAKIKKIEDNEIIVEFSDKDEIIEKTVEKHEWKNIKYSWDEQEKRIKEEVIGRFIQYPIKLAWAITVHKSQGLTFEKVIADLGNAFDSGQVYVALSRCTSFNGLVLRSRIRRNAIITNPQVLEFANNETPSTLIVKELNTGKADFYYKKVRKEIQSLSFTEAYDNFVKAIKYRNDIETDLFKKYFITIANKLSSFKQKYFDTFNELQINQQENNELQNVISGLEKEKIRQESEINVKDINYRFLFDENGNNKNQIEILKTHISALIEETARLDKIIFTNKQQLELLNEHLKFVTNEKLNAENTNKKYKILIQEKENVIKLLNVEIERLSNIKWHQKLFGKK
jgi:energy-coupling factor transporter ATP-binding protein EcfA2